MQAMRRYLRLMSLHGTDQMLQDIVPHISKQEPRQRLISRREREEIMSQSALDMRIFLLFCGDLGLRSGTAVRVAAQHWDKQRDTLRINALKHGGSIVMPLTEELKAALNMCEQLTPFAADLPYVERARMPRPDPQSTNDQRINRLGNRFVKIVKRLGIPDIRPHDFRRTLAENIYNATGDMRQVQGALGHSALSSTTHYLQRDTNKPSRELLERIKTA